MSKVAPSVHILYALVPVVHKGGRACGLNALKGPFRDAKAVLHPCWDGIALTSAQCPLHTVARQLGSTTEDVACQLIVTARGEDCERLPSGKALVYIGDRHRRTVCACGHHPQGST